MQICHLEDGSHFGEISLVRATKRSASVVAVENCELFRLDRKDFVRVVMPYPDMLKKIEQIATDRTEMIISLNSEYSHRKQADSTSKPKQTTKSKTKSTLSNSERRKSDAAQRARRHSSVGWRG